MYIPYVYIYQNGQVMSLYPLATHATESYFGGHPFKILRLVRVDLLYVSQKEKKKRKKKGSNDDDWGFTVAKKCKKMLHSRAFAG